MLELWHLASLDAPTVAALWCVLLARAANAPLPAFAPWLLALATWSVYALDRLLDARRPRETLRPRHEFHARHARAFAAGLALAAAAFLFYFLPRMSRSVLRGDAILAAPFLAYFAAVHGRGGRRLPKEMLVGVIFASAVAMPALARSPRPLSAAPAAALFAGLCWWNCAAIQRWEDAAYERRDLGAARGRTLELGAAALAAAAAAGIAFAPASRGAFAAGALSAAACAVLARLAPSLDALDLRVAADLALCTPILVLPFWPRP